MLSELMFVQEMDSVFAKQNQETISQFQNLGIRAAQRGKSKPKKGTEESYSDQTSFDRTSTYSMNSQNLYDQGKTGKDL